MALILEQLEGHEEIKNAMMIGLLKKTQRGYSTTSYMAIG